MITRDDVEHAAKLSRLKLTEDELDRFAGDLERIVAYVEQLMVVDVEGVEPMTHPAGAARRRDDVVGPVLGNKALAGGPGYDADEGVVRVPRVIE